MIRLTRANGQALYVNPEHLIEVGYDEDYKQTLVSTLAEGWYIQESPSEVARKVLEWRLAMIDYHHDIPSVKTKAMAELVRLAGLEEPEHD
jgi:Uncharacterized protein, possibly involved in motility